MAPPEAISPPKAPSPGDCKPVRTKVGLETLNGLGVIGDDTTGPVAVVGREPAATVSSPISLITI